MSAIKGKCDAPVNPAEYQKKKQQHEEEEKRDKVSTGVTRGSVHY